MTEPAPCRKFRGKFKSGSMDSNRARVGAVFTSIQTCTAFLQGQCYCCRAECIETHTKGRDDYLAACNSWLATSWIRAASAAEPSAFFSLAALLASLARLSRTCLSKPSARLAAASEAAVASLTCRRSSSAAARAVPRPSRQLANSDCRRTAAWAREPRPSCHKGRG